MTNGRIRGLFLALLAAVAIYLGFQRDFTNSIEYLIPEEHDAEFVDLALKLVDSPLSRRMILSVGGQGASRELARSMAASLRSHPKVVWVQAGFDDDALREVYGLYFTRRIFLASDRPESEIPELFTPEALDERASQLRRALAGPDSMLLARVAGDDPLGIFERVVARMRAAAPGAGGGVVEGGAYSILMLGLRASPFDGDRQRELLSYIDSEFARLGSAMGGGFELEMSGANRIALASERSIRSDVNLISSVSIVLVGAIFLFFFRSLRQLGIAMLVPASGFAASLAVALSGTEPVHGVTLGFGFVLMGITVDYPIHLANHVALSGRGDGPWLAMRQIRASLALSGLTTTLAFAVLSLSDFPGLQEMGIFVAIGIPVSLAVVLFVVPAFLAAGGPTPAQRSLSRSLRRLVEWLRNRPRFRAALLAGYVVVFLLGVPRLDWVDDPAALLAMDEGLLAEGERVRERMGVFEGGRFVVGVADDAEAALVLNERIYERLHGLVAAGEIDKMGSLHSFLWSRSLQERNLDAFRSVPDVGKRLERAFIGAGFREDAFHGFARKIESPAAEPLRPSDLAGTPLAPLLDLLVEVDGRWAVVTPVEGVESGSALRDELEGLAGAHYVDQNAIVGELYQGYRESTVRMVMAGCLAVLLILQMRYRSLRVSLLAFSTAALAAGATFGVFGLVGAPVSVVSAMSALVVVGAGVDYGIFAVYGAREPANVGISLSSILVSGLTSISVFGALALSSQPVLRSIGSTSGLGVALALVLSPVIAATLRRH